METLYIELEQNQEMFNDVNAALAKLQTISEMIGRVPVLNNDVTLPDPEFMPPLYYKSTQSKWARELWFNPSRSTVGEVVSFISCTIRGAAVRIYLLNYEDIKLTPLTQPQGRAICYAIGDFVEIGNLEVDHLQPSHDILERQKELVLAMNLDFRFGSTIYNSPANKEYIYLDCEGRYVGTKKFYMEYHNDVGNFWFISKSADTTCGKLGQDSVIWLRSQKHFGDAFLRDIVNIDKRCILYKTQVGEGLAEAAREWFHRVNKDAIALQGYHQQTVTLPMYDKHREMQLQEAKLEEGDEKMFSVVDASSKMAQRQKTKRQDRLDLLVTSSMQGELAKKSSSKIRTRSDSKSDSELSSVHTSDAEPTEENVDTLMEEVKQADLLALRTDLVSKFKAKRREKKRFKYSTL